MLCRRSIFSGSCFFFWCYIMLHSSAPFFRKTKKALPFFARQRLFVLLFSCIAHSILLQQKTALQLHKKPKGTICLFTFSFIPS
ncbi:hypothetical protein DSY4670 [Desulfitobacterium hafniense Y51]|uniref:Uncharacterized protein n=1 Tax=Desulfitobacterium hafniense (strain Y51) TaxID=138119 RepID=Q24ND3_DESHY|nr:hypothetical protein DSY4670 [Desulfitobacterium hafniense Y51]